MSGVSAPSLPKDPARLDREVTVGGLPEPRVSRKPVDSALQLWSVRLVVSVVIGLLLIATVVEAIRLRSYYQESGWVARLAVWYEQQAADADKKSEALRKQAGKAEDPTEASRLDQEATRLVEQSQLWKQQARQAREAGEQRSFDWLPRSRSLAGHLGDRGS
jgi:hypothetical protein